MTLKCHASGLPVPTFAWMTPDGYYINATKSVYETPDDDSQNTRGKKLEKDGSLLVFNTRVHDQGIYKCVAFNVMGKDERSVNLTVREGKIRFSVECKGNLRLFWFGFTSCFLVSSNTCFTFSANKDLHRF